MLTRSSKRITATARAAALARTQTAPGLPATPDLADLARAQLEELIVKLELPPGSIWSEVQLSERIGIGRTPTREALQRLEAEYLVRVLPRLGVQVTEISVTQQLLLLEVRRELERLITRSAARRALPHERETMFKMADSLEALVDADVLKFLRYHYDIKSFIAACSRNEFAARAIAPAHAMSRRFYYLHYRQVHDLPVAARHHAHVIRTIALGEEERAAQASDLLMDYVDELTRSTVTHRA